MSLSLFTTKNNYYKNGIWFSTKMLCRLIGEERYDYLRLFRRISCMRFYYARQQLLYELFIDHPDLAQWTGTYPKVDSSHGFPFYSTYEMYRDFQENTLNSDGSFAQYITLFCAIYCIHTLYNYMMPYYWIHSPLKNDEYTRLRMKDCIASTVWEELGALDWAEWGWLPHDFAYARIRGFTGYSHPDDPRTMHIASLNRKSRYMEHYITRVGDYHHMTYPK